MNMQFKKRTLFFCFILPTSLSAAPMISVDSTDYDNGVIMEGTNSVTRHSFTLKNTGDKELKIESVKPSCGCTAVGYDTIIPPGKSGKITQEIRLSGIHGPFRKYLTVVSNAKNTPTLRLSLGGILRSELEFSPEFLSLELTENKAEWKAEISINSLQSDLTVSEVRFKPEDFGQSGPTWQESIPIYLNYKLIKDTNKNADGYHSYKLKINLPYKGDMSRNGDMFIKTNNPKKPEFTIRGVFQEK